MLELQMKHAASLPPHGAIAMPAAGPAQLISNPPCAAERLSHHLFLYKSQTHLQ